MAPPCFIYRKSGQYKFGGIFVSYLLKLENIVWSVLWGPRPLKIMMRCSFNKAN